MERTQRVLLAKIGLDGHDRGLKVLAKKFSDAGIEVVYLGLFQTVEGVVNTAVQEDVDIIGISVLDGGQTLIAEDLMVALKAVEKTETKVVFGGIIPERDRSYMMKLGVHAIFGPGTPIQDIVLYIKGE